MSIGTWSDFYTYNDNNIDLYVMSKPGNYQLYTKNPFLSFTLFYAGKSDGDLHRRLKEHLSSYETNNCIKKMLKNNVCYFRFIYVSTQKEREKIESDDIRNNKPPCNIQQP